MKTLYSILSIQIRPEIQEKVTVGLLFYNKSQGFFGYSEHKIRPLKSLLPDGAYKMAREILTSLETKVSADHAPYDSGKRFRIFINSHFDPSFSDQYMDYIHRYANNIISYSEPKAINVSATYESFIKLFEAYVDKQEEIYRTQAPPINPVEIITAKFGHKIHRHYKVKEEITSHHVPNLIAPVRVDFSGKNEIDVLIQTVNMEGSYETIMREITGFYQLKDTYKRNQIQLKDFVFSKEPSSSKPAKIHEVWNNLRHSNFFNYHDLSECEIIVEYAEKHNVVPLDGKE